MRFLRLLSPVRAVSVSPSRRTKEDGVQRYGMVFMPP
jgi:hypothetical protein